MELLRDWRMSRSDRFREMDDNGLIQLDPANSNSVISDSPLFRTQNYVLWIFSSVIHYRFFLPLAISNYVFVSHEGSK